MIFRFVSIRQSNPFSIREIVMGETFAFLESSALLIIKDSLIFFTEFFVILELMCGCYQQIPSSAT